MMNRWEIYELLKNGKKLSFEQMKKISESNSQELAEGIIEFIEMKERLK